MLRVAIIGCGKQADAHAAAIQEVQGCELVGVCDRDELMAKQLYERFPVKAYFSDAVTLLEKAQPDVVHIVTPPQSHLSLGRACLEAGCHVFFEKPFALNAREAAEVVALATARNVKVTVGHNNQFNSVSVRMRAMVADGFLGGSPVHMESTWCYDLGDKTFAAALLGDKGHWVRRLPGRLLHNIISHGIGRMAEFLHGDTARVLAWGFRSPMLVSLGEMDIVDELRVIIVDSQETSAYFTFSTQIVPRVQQFKLCGSQNSLLLDDIHQTLVAVNRGRYKYYLNHFIPPLSYARQYVANAKTNIGQFLRRDFHFEGGRRRLIEAFYRAIREEGPLPLSYREILLTSRIMDEIFAQLWGIPGASAPDLVERETV